MLCVHIYVYICTYQSGSKTRKHKSWTVSPKGHHQAVGLYVSAPLCVLLLCPSLSFLTWLRLSPKLVTCVWLIFAFSGHPLFFCRPAMSGIHAFWMCLFSRSRPRKPVLTPSHPRWAFVTLLCHSLIRCNSFEWSESCISWSVKQALSHGRQTLSNAKHLT